MIVMRSQGAGRAEGPFHNAACRTYSNGSIDERSIADALAGLPPPPAGLNGTVQADA